MLTSQYSSQSLNNMESVPDQIAVKAASTTNRTFETDQLSYDCDDCSLRFTDVNILFRHRLMHASKTTSEPVQKDFCTMSSECLLCPLQMHAKVSNDRFNISSNREGSICLNYILTESELASHLLDWHTTCDSTVFQCCNCGGSFNRAVDLRCYVDVNQSTGIEVLKVGSIYFFSCGCEECKLNFKTTETPKISCAQTLRYRCLVCTRIFFCGQKVQLHMRNHTVEKRNNWTFSSDEESFVTYEERFTCMDCGKCFGDRSRFERHHCRQALPTQGSGKFELHNYICNLCGAKFDDSRLCREHKISHSKLGRKPFKCNICPKRYTHKERLEKHMQRHNNGEKLHGCYYCSKRFNYMSHVKRHLEVHLQNSEKPYNCELCPKRFSTKQCLTKHMYAHTGEKPFVCKYCDKAYFQSSHLQRHMKSHTKDGGRSLQCDLCPKKFAAKQVLERHRYVHTGERPFRCTYCTKSYTQPTHLSRHLKSHVQFGERVYECNRCESKFDSKVLLNIHKLTHSEKTYTCKCCSSDFARMSDLRVHMRAHIKNGEKPYKCDNCPKQFMTVKLLTRHVEIHHQATNYTCSVCRKEFSKNSSLKRHQKLSRKCSRKLGLGRATKKTNGSNLA